MVFQQSEVVCLFLALAFAVPAIILVRLVTVPHSRLFFIAFFLAIAASALTVLEDVVLPDLLNLLEHVCYTASALVFATACWLLAGKLEKGGEGK